MPPDVSIIIVSWNVRDLLRACLRSLLSAEAEAPGGPSQEVIVVDSASADGSPEMVRAEFPAVRLIASPENLGYSRGNNLGLQEARGRYLLLLNPDTRALEGAVAAMCAYMDAHPDVGVLGPQLLWPDGSVQPSARRFPSLVTTFLESTWLQRWTPQRLLRHYYAQDMPPGQVVEVDWVVGAALLVRREAYAQVGGLDEGYFMYSEELDWQRRLKAAGWRVVYFPLARFIHYEGRSSAQVPAATHIRFNSSKVRYVRNYHGPAAAEALRLYLLGSFAWQLGLEWAKGALGHKRALRQARVAAYREVLRSGLRG